jgi:hypothetical protein
MHVDPWGAKEIKYLFIEITKMTTKNNMNIFEKNYEFQWFS